MMRAVKIITEKVANRKWRVGMPAEDKWLAEKDENEYVTDAKRKISAVVHRGRCAAPCRALPQRPFAGWVEHAGRRHERS